MFKKEFKNNFKSFIIWISIIISMFILVFAIYPSISANSDAMNQFINTMPKEMLEMFNMDVVGFGTVFGWIATEGFMMLTLIGGAYFAIMGSNILLKEENDGTIEFLYSKPVTRNNILFSKILVGVFFVLIFNLLISLVTLIGLLASNGFDFNKWALISFIPMLLHLFFFSISFLLAIFFTKTRKSLGVSLGVLFGLYLLNMLSAMSDKIEFLKYFSPFYYINARSILTENNINVLHTFVILFCSFIFIFISFKYYNKKELT